MLTGKVGLVTGAGSGIGRACAVALAEAGAGVLATDIDEVGLAQTVDLATGAAGAVHTARCDVSHRPDVEAMVEAALARFGRVDFAVNNAGIVGKQMSLIDYSDEDYDRIMDVNLKSVFFCLRAELRQMLEQGQGSVVNIASEAALKGSAADAVYTASKCGVAGFTKTAALEVARRGVRVNAVCPGAIETGITEALKTSNPAGWERGKKLMPIGRYGRPEEIAAAVVWLCSDAASLMNGHLMAVDGGWAVK